MTVFVRMGSSSGSICAATWSQHDKRNKNTLIFIVSTLRYQSLQTYTSLYNVLWCYFLLQLTHVYLVTVVLGHEQSLIESVITHRQRVLQSVRAGQHLRQDLTVRTHMDNIFRVEPTDEETS